MRVNKYLSSRGQATRRGADELIRKGRVRINGRPAVLGDKVTEADRVEVSGSPETKKYVYLAYHKPIGVVTATPAGLARDIFPLGRLDKNSHGLIILTNDGRVTDRLLNPERAHEKEYLVRTTDKLRSNFKKQMATGVNIEGEITRPCAVTIKSDFEFTVKLTEGKRHQIRRMCAALKNGVADLKRVRIMDIELGRLASGTYRPIVGEELARFLKNLNL
ncbi:MAG: pseudouridine synthase [Patescibacteria group bacterium]